MLIHPDKSCLLLIDIQERLAPSISNGSRVINNCCWLTDIATQAEYSAARQ